MNGIPRYRRSYTRDALNVSTLLFWPSSSSLRWEEQIVVTRMKKEGVSLLRLSSYAHSQTQFFETILPL